MSISTQAVAVAIVLAAFPVRAEVVVIANEPGLVSPGEVREVYLGDKQFGAGNVRLVVSDNAAAQAEFLAKALNLDVARYNAAWTKKSFREGLNPPPVRATDADVVAFVKQTRGAIGYVSSSPQGVAVIVRLP